MNLNTTKEVEFEGEIFNVKPVIWLRYVDFYVNKSLQQTDTIYVRDVKTVNDFKKYAKRAIKMFIAARKATETLNQWDGKL